MSVALVSVDKSTGEVTQEVRAVVPMVDFVAHLSDPAALDAQQKMMAAYDAACRALVGPNDVQREGSREFKKKSAWRKLGRHFQISTEVLRAQGEFRALPDGTPYYYAEAHVRATAPWGQSMEAVAACDTLESRFNGRGGGQAKMKAGNDCLATAETRATNRAISNLIAAGEVSAEEMEHQGARGGASDRQAPRAGGDQSQQQRGRGDAADNPACPNCGGRMWDNRATKTNPRAPDFKCRDRQCNGAIWPPKGPKESASPPRGEMAEEMERNDREAGGYDDYEAPPFEDDDDLPF